MADRICGHLSLKRLLVGWLLRMVVALQGAGLATDRSRVQFSADSLLRNIGQLSLASLRGR